MAYNGIAAKLSVMNGETVEDIGYISNFSVEESKSVVEITAFGKDCKEKLPSIYGWSASAAGIADFNTATGQKKLREAMIKGQPVKVRFYLDKDKIYLEGTAYIESMSLDISAEDKGNISISLSGDGELTMTEVPQTPAV